MNTSCIELWELKDAVARARKKVGKKQRKEEILSKSG